MNDSSLQAGEREISKDATRSAKKQNPLYCSKNRKEDERCDEKLRKKLDWHKQEDSIPWCLLMPETVIWEEELAIRILDIWKFDESNGCKVKPI